MSIKNTCTPTKVFGPYTRWNFLGLSVKSFEINGNFGNDSSEITIELVRDYCAGEPYYYLNSSLQIQSSTGADPGPIFDSYNLIGCPAIFRCNDFEYSGIIQSYDNLDSFSGETYRVRMSDPRLILENARIITGEYAGIIVGSVYNIFNVFGFMEQFGSACPMTYLSALPPEPSNYVAGNTGVDGAMFGSLAGGFGGAYRSDNGMQANRVYTGLTLLCNSAPALSNSFSPHGRVMYNGINYIGYGVLGYDRVEVLGPFAGSSGYLSEYILDLSELPNPGNSYRLAASDMSVMDFISEICDITSRDYYIELIPIRGVASAIASSGIAKIIKVRTVSRATQPALGKITTFIGNSTGTLSSSVGLELRNETTSSFLVGGQKEMVYQIEQDDNPGDGPFNGYPDEADDIITPYFGQDPFDNAILVSKDSKDEWFFYAPITPLNEQIRTLGPLADGGNNLEYDSLKITEFELLAAIQGFDEWLIAIFSKYVDGPNAGNFYHQIGKAIDDTGNMNVKTSSTIVDKFFAIVNDIVVNGKNAENLVRDIKQIGPILNSFEQNQIIEDLNKCYDWVKNYAENYYGVRYQVRIPYTCVRYDNESGKILSSEEPCGSGWTEESSVIQMTNGWFNYDGVNYNLIQKFQDESNKILPFVRYDGVSTKQFLYTMDPDEYVYNSYETDEDDLKLWVRADVEDEFVYLDKDTRFSPRAVISTTPIRPFSDDKVEGRGFYFELLDRLILLADDMKDKLDEAKEKVGGKLINVALEAKPEIPNAAAIPIRSNITTYGPWAAVGPAGSVRFEKNDSLVPWEYNGLANLNLAGNLLVTNGLSLMKVEEMGDVVIPGYPDIPLGAEIGAVAGGYFGTGTNLVENRTIASSNFSENDYAGNAVALTHYYYTFGAWDGTYGPNITSINVSVSEQGVQTRYQMRTFTRKPGQIGKLNAERLRKAGKASIERSKDYYKINNRLNSEASFAKKISDRKNKKSSETRSENLKSKTPHEVFVGQLITWDNTDSDGKRTSVTTNRIDDLPYEIEFNYDKKAFMSLDGLLRPVSMDGDGSLPRYIRASGDKGQSVGSQPPVYYNQSGDIFSDGYNPTGSLDSLEYNVVIDVDYLNPFSNPSGYNRSSLGDRCDTYTGHDIEIIGRGGTGDFDTLTMPIEGYDKTGEADYNNDYRMMALKGPLLLQQWGYDTNGVPVPNSADTVGAASSGDFTEDNLTDKFLNNFLKKPQTWPVAPVDLRLDRKRGVWVAPPPYRLLNVTANEYIPPFGTGWATLTSNSGDLWTSSGTTITNGQIQAVNKVGDHMFSGDPLLVYYDVQNGDYWVINKRPNLIICKTTSTIPVATTSGDNLVMGSGTATLYTRSYSSSSVLTPVSGNGGNVSVNIYNMAGGDEIGNSSFVVVGQVQGGELAVIVEPCEQPTSG